jgi:hypothetical protein
VYIKRRFHSICIKKVDDADKNFDKGLTNYESKPCGQLLIVYADLSNMLATSDDETGETFPYNNIYIRFYGTTAGTYTEAEADLRYGEGGTWYVSDGNPVTVTKYEDAGGVIEGTFSGTIFFDLEDRVITEEEFSG